MNAKQSILLSFAILGLFTLMLFIIFGESGLADLNILRSEKMKIEEANEKTAQESISKHREIDRLRNDPEYIEKIARGELGMVRKGEIIIKPRKVDRLE